MAMGVCTARPGSCVILRSPVPGDALGGRAWQEELSHLVWALGYSLTLLWICFLVCPVMGKLLQTHTFPAITACDPVTHEPK